MIRSILSFLVSNRVFELSWQVFFWTSLGAAGGTLLGIASFLFIRSRSGYRLEVRGGRWWRALVCAVNIVAFTLGFGYVGLCEGTWRGVREAATKSSLITGLSSNLGKVEAVFLAGAYYAALGVRNNPRITPAEELQVIDEGVDAFVEGRAEINVRDLQWQLKTIGREVVGQAIGVVESKAVTLVPLLGAPKSKAILRKVLDELGQALVHDQARKGLQRLRLDAYLDQLLASLPAEAARSGSLEGITFREMSDQLGRVSLIDWVLDATRSFLRGQQLFALVALAVTLGLPVLLFRLVRNLTDDPGQSTGGRRPKGSCK